MDFHQLYTAVIANPTGAFLAMSVSTNVWLAKRLLESHAAHLKTALVVAPIAAKLGDAVAAVERVVARLTGGAP